MVNYLEKLNKFIEIRDRVRDMMASRKVTRVFNRRSSTKRTFGEVGRRIPLDQMKREIRRKTAPKPYYLKLVELRTLYLLKP